MEGNSDTTGRRWQTKLVGTWKVTQIHGLRRESVKQQTTKRQIKTEKKLMFLAWLGSVLPCTLPPPPPPPPVSVDHTAGLDAKTSLPTDRPWGQMWGGSYQRFNPSLARSLYLSYLPGINKFGLPPSASCIWVTCQISTSLVCHLLPVVSELPARYQQVWSVTFCQLYLSYLLCINKFGLPPSASCTVNRNITNEVCLLWNRFKGMYIFLFSFCCKV